MSLSPDDTPVPRRNRAALWLVTVALLALAAYLGWTWWQRRVDAETADLGRQVDAISQRVNAIRGEQRSYGRRLQQADSLNRVLRDELNGIGQRASLLEDSVAKLADPDRFGAQALRLDETELLLALGERRLLIAGDLDGARRAYALASGVLAGVNDPAYLNLRQTLLQERAALDALGTDPRVQAMARLDAFARGVTAPDADRPATPDARAPWWQRAFGNLLQVQPSDRAVAVQASDRAAALAGLQLEISLARAAAERRDDEGYRQALARTEGWLERLVVESDALRQQRAALHEIASLPLSPSLPTLGSTLQQLRQQRAR